MSTNPKEIFLKDYAPSNYSISTVHLTFDIFDKHTEVTNNSQFKRETGLKELFLNGINLELLEIKIDGKDLNKDEYEVSEKGLTIKNPPKEFTLHTKVKIDPANNKQLMGLYMSDGMYCTQNEPEGFRRMTYHIDRPDVMSVFTTTIRADKEKYPVMLSNGNPVVDENLSGLLAKANNNSDIKPDTQKSDRFKKHHEITWHDPFPKPTYLFALVAGDLVITENSFTTMSGRIIPLRIYTEAKHQNRTEHAMESLIKSMKWDEERFGREYDLDIFMIVAVDAFNSGAMENKGLNIFNASCVLCDPTTASDGDYKFIERVVAHEYFHNWTGNRITCRDWFQLTLKEGLTVHRDTEFSMDMGDPTIKRIEDVSMLKEHQFAEDSGPMAHPIKPPSFIQIENFYTATVYEKGSEVIRMLQTMYGKDGFRKAMDLYFETFDGQAVTTEDFLWSFEEALGVSLSQFKESWYQQSGTPVLKVESEYDEEKKEYKLILTQGGNIGTPYKKNESDEDLSGLKSLDTEKSTMLNDQKPDRFNNWTPFIYPLELGLINENGKELKSQTHIVENMEEEIIFTNIENNPIPSLLRNFSAPIKLEYNYTLKEDILLFAHDTDNFNRYEAGQRIAKRIIEEIKTQHYPSSQTERSGDLGSRKSDLFQDETHRSRIKSGMTGDKLGITDSVIESYKSILNDTTLDPGFKAECLTLPGLYTLVSENDVYEYQEYYQAKKEFQKTLAKGLETELLQNYNSMREETFSKSGESMGKRSLKNICLSYLTEIDSIEDDTQNYDDAYISLAYYQFQNANNMTDQIRSLAVLNKFKSDFTRIANKSFYEQWKDDSLVITKYFAVLASSPREDVLEIVKELEQNEVFDKTSPNKVRSLYGCFGRNYPFFHSEDGKGYEFIADKILEVDSFNGKIAGGLTQIFRQYKSMPQSVKPLIKTQLERIKSTKTLSDITFEVVTKILESGKE